MAGSATPALRAARTERRQATYSASRGWSAGWRSLLAKSWSGSRSGAGADDDIAESRLYPPFKADNAHRSRPPLARSDDPVEHPNLLDEGGQGRERPGRDGRDEVANQAPHRVLVLDL